MFLLFFVFLLPLKASWLGEIPDYLTDTELEANQVSFKSPTEKIIQTNYAINTKAIKPQTLNPDEHVKIFKKTADIFNEAVRLYEKGNIMEAINKFVECIEYNPHISQPWSILSNVFKALGKSDLSIDYAKQACIVEPSTACEANMANLYLDRRNTAADAREQDKWLRMALEHYKKAVDPQKDATMKLQLAHAFIEAGQYKEALLETKKAARYAPTSADVYFTMGLSYKNLMLYELAKQCYEKSIELNSSKADSYKGLALLYQYVYFDVASAIRYHNKALQIGPNDHTTLHNLASAYNMVGLLDEAIAMYDEVLKIDPKSKQTFMEMVNLRMRTCDWTNRDEYMEKTRNQVINEISSAGSSTLASWYATNYPLSASILKHIAVSFSNTLIPLRNSLPTPFKYPKKATGRIKVGIVTSDLGDTNVGRDVVGWFRYHDPKTSKIQITVYATKQNDGSVWRRDVEQNAEKVVDVSLLSNYEVAKLINDDGIHIAINLNGYTKHSKNEMFALQPAPIQVNMKGYPGTMGSSWIHYIITDRNASPMEHADYYTEKFIYMPNSYFLSSYPDIFSHVVNNTYISTFSRSQWGLPESDFIFCDFNHLTKVDPQIFTVWMNILKRVPNSIMWFLRLPSEAEKNLKKEAGNRGVDPERLLFTDMLPLKDHLVVKSMCNIFLDTTVFNAHGTGMDILWAGVPIITMMSETFQSRAAGSYAITIGCPEMIVKSLKEYEERAVELALDYQAGGDILKKLRSKLEENRLTSPLFNTKRFVRDWELSMELIWKIYEDGSTPRHVEVPNEEWTQTIKDWMDSEVTSKFW